MDFFIEFALIICIATAISILFKFLKQPLIVGYILTGLVVGPYSLNILNTTEQFETFSQFGIALLLFIVGLSLSPNVIKEVGKIAVLTGAGQVVFTSVIGFVICLLFGFSNKEALYIAVALTFSSTIIVLKLLSDKGDLESLYGKITIGFLIVQDIIASIILIALNSYVVAGQSGSYNFVPLLTNLFFLTIGLFITVKFLLPRLLEFLASSQESLFIFSIAWGLGLASLFQLLGLSLEIGALVAGVLLSLFPFHYEISSKTKPLRDFFLIIFFIFLGTKLNVYDLPEIWISAVLLSIFVLIGNPLIVILLMSRFGYKKRTSFLAGLTVAQISEFSLILIAFGIKVGEIDHKILSLVTLVGFITIALSSYMILYSQYVYPRIKKFLKYLEKKNTLHEISSISSYDVILFGYNRVGFDVVEKFKQMDIRFLVIDHDPESIKLLNQTKIANLYGDAEDGDFLDELPLNQAKMIVSTIPDYDVNYFLITKIKEHNKEALTLVVAHSIQHAFNLYEMGVDYVIMPHFLGGEYASNLIFDNRFNSELFGIERDKHISELIRRKKLGHEHPKITRK